MGQSTLQLQAGAEITLAPKELDHFLRDIEIHGGPAGAKMMRNPAGAEDAGQSTRTIAQNGHETHMNKHDQGRIGR